MKGVAKVQSPQQKLHDMAMQREAGSQHLSVMPSGLGRVAMGGVSLTSTHSLPREQWLLSAVGDRMRAIVHDQSRLAKLYSVGK